MTTSIVLRDVVLLALHTASALEERPDSNLDSFVLSVTEAGKAIIENSGRYPSQGEIYLEDMRLLVSVAEAILERKLSRDRSTYPRNFTIVI
ncbi:hypothetical protein GN244_ATG09457 [Phytophthora infestans]|uniref:Uncharacterized protein n=1 Tax=Phytophthora infestans TaxID=4787 RepID=A0A833T3B9_PHYIN|nr:hypothetical protein GN244_ATG09457 [Phytophthora infestans]